MPRTVQIRDMDDDAYDALRRRAAGFGLPVPEYLRQEVERLAARLTVNGWIAQTRRRTTPPERLDTLAALDELRGTWPE